MKLVSTLNRVLFVLEEEQNLDLFRMDKEQELTAEVLKEFIGIHGRQRVRYTELKNHYLSRPPILEREPKVESWKPDNKIVSNYSKYIIDTFNGFFNGIPMRVNHDEDNLNEVIQDFWNRNSIDNVMNELAKTTSIYGRGYLFLYQDENAQTNVAYNDPFDMFVIYSDEIRPSSLYGIRYVVDEDGYKGQLFTDTEAYDFTLEGNKLSLGESHSLFYGRIPIIEFIENEERQSLIEPVESLINAYNEALSGKLDDIDYFADAYLSILGALLDDESIKHLKDNRIINMAGDGAEKVTVEFLDKPDADQTQENFLDRTERLIYQLSQVANINDTTFSASNSSGVALEFKLQPMKNLALNKERKFEQGIQTMLQMLFNVNTSIPQSQKQEYMNVGYDWSRNLPANNEAEASVVRSLDGIVSHRKQLEMLSAVDDAQAELEAIEEENAPLPQYDFEMGE